jgi:hypothetical protein
MPVIGETKLHVDGNHQATWNGKSWEVRAVDPVSIRQQRAYADAELSKESQGLTRMLPLAQTMREYGELNTRQGRGPLDALTGGRLHFNPNASGSLFDQLPFSDAIRDPIIRMWGGPRAQMLAKEKSLQVQGVTPGQGQVTENERKLFAGEFPNLRNPGPVNQSIIRDKLSLVDNAKDRLAFRQAWVAQHGNLYGAEDGYKAYKQQQKAGPKPQPKPAYSVPSGQTLISNAKETVAARTPLPPENQRKVGQYYDTPTGRWKWAGQGWVR